MSPMRMTRASAAMVLGTALVAAGCGPTAKPATPTAPSASTPSAAPATGRGVTSVAIKFALTSNGQRARCGAPLGVLGTDGKAATLRDARFYVQDVELLDKSGRSTRVQLKQSEWQRDNVTLVDFEDATGDCKSGTAGTNMQVVGEVPAGKYAGLSFVVGVPEELNHTSTEQQAAPLDVTAMAWAWQAGRKFAKIEIIPEGGISRPTGAKATAWMIHLGSSGCSGNPVTGESVTCQRPNRAPVRFQRFNVSSDTVALDLSDLFRESRVSEDAAGAIGCMSAAADPECAPVFKRLGVGLADGAQAPTAGRLAFRVATRH